MSSESGDINEGKMAENRAAHKGGNPPNGKAGTEEIRKTEREEDEVEDELRLQWLCRRFVRHFLRGLGFGSTLYVGAKIVTGLLKNPFREGGWASFRREIICTDGLRFATFFGLYPSVYHLTVTLLRYFRRKQDGWNYGWAGGLAGLTIAVDNPSRRSVLALFTIARALGAGVTTLVSRGHIRALPYGETALFCLCCSFLLTCVGRCPQFLAKGYYRSVIKWSRDYNDDILRRMFRVPGDRFLTCQELGVHKDSCTHHAFEDFLRSFPMFAKLYFPIHATPVVVFKRKKLKENPGYVLMSLLRNTVMSGAFLATMVLLAKYTICRLRSLHGLPPPAPAWVLSVAGFMCGLSVLLERASRRKELTLFLIPHSLYALLLMAEKSRLAPAVRLPFLPVLLFSAAMMSVMHAYEREPKSLTPLIDGLLRFFVGKREYPVPLSKRLRMVSESM